MSGSGYVPDWGVVALGIPVLLRGLTLTVATSLVAFAAAIAWATVVALAALSPLRALRWCAFCYVQLFRSLSTYLYILWIYFALPLLIGVKLPGIVAGGLSLACLHSAYLAEILRSSLQAVDREQWIAARAMGLSGIDVLFFVILPQAFWIALPSVINQFVQLVKDSSLLAFIGVPDLMRSTMDLVAFYSRSVEFYTATALLYLLVTLGISTLARRLELRVHRWAIDG